MTLRHDDIMTWRPDCMMPCESMSRWCAVCGPKAGGAGVASCFFWQTSANSLQKPTTLSANSHKSFQQNFHQTFSNFPQTFSKRPKKGWKSGLLSLFLSPTFPRPSEIRRARKFPIPLPRQLRPTRPADGAGLYSPHSAVSPPVPASWQSNRSITKGREKARRKTKKRTMRISHSQGLTVVRLLHESDVCFHINHHSSRH